MSFESAQQLYDQQEPPYEDWDECIDNSILLGDLEGKEIRGAETCPHCPAKHKCRIGITIITTKRENAWCDNYAAIIMTEFEH